jgi:hypothetical protein
MESPKVFASMLNLFNGFKNDVNFEGNNEPAATSTPCIRCPLLLSCG